MWYDTVLFRVVCSKLCMTCCWISFYVLTHINRDPVFHTFLIPAPNRILSIRNTKSRHFLFVLGSWHCINSNGLTWFVTSNDNWKTRYTSTRSKHSFYLSSVTSYMFRPICSHHQTDHDNKTKVRDKIFTAARDTWHLKPLQIYCYKIRLCKNNFSASGTKVLWNDKNCMYEV